MRADGAAIRLPHLPATERDLKFCLIWRVICIGWRRCIRSARYDRGNVSPAFFCSGHFCFRQSASSAERSLDYIDSPDCILRVKLERAGRRIILPDGVRLNSADRIIELHFRNEYFPAMDAKGATLAWARRVARLMDLSLKELYKYLQGRSDLNDVAAIRAVMLLRSSDQAAQFERIASRSASGPCPNPTRSGAGCAAPAKTRSASC